MYINIIIYYSSLIKLNQSELNLFKFLLFINNLNNYNCILRVAGGWVRDKLMNNESDENKAKSQVDEMCKKLLANLVIEDFKII